MSGEIIASPAGRVKTGALVAFLARARQVVTRKSERKSGLTRKRNQTPTTT